MLKRVEVIPLKSHLVKEGEDVVGIIIKLLKRSRIRLKDKDVIVIADKILAISEGRIVNYEKTISSEEAKILSEKYALEPGFVQIVLDESERIFGGVKRAILSINNGILMANAGVDHKNAPVGFAALWPKDPDGTARRIREELEKRTGKRVGVVISDSRVNPMRRGTVGIAIGSSGILPVIDCRGKTDLFGKSLKITFINVVDDLACMAHMVMGETTEMTPVVLIRNANIILDGEATSEQVKISEDECLIVRSIKEYFAS
ncbi:MAG: coenzyme F420-0:L-glutamate ligase [Nitrososphaeria archaeon]